MNMSGGTIGCSNEPTTLAPSLMAFGVSELDRVRSSTSGPRDERDSLVCFHSESSSFNHEKVSLLFRTSIAPLLSFHHSVGFRTQSTGFSRTSEIVPVSTSTENR